MLMENNFINDLTKQIGFICDPRSSTLIDTLQIFTFRIMFAVQEFGSNQQMVKSKNLTKQMKGMTIDTQMKTPDFLIQGKTIKIMNVQINLLHSRKGFDNLF